MMRRPLCFLLVLLVISSVQLSCSTGPDKPDEALTEDGARAPDFFKYIPSNSPYVITSLEPFPMDVLEPYLETYVELYDTLDKQLKQQYPGQSFQKQASAEEKFMFALFGELRKASTLEGYKELGLSTRPHAAIYGVGWFPVMRLTLGDAEAFEATLQRLEAEAGLQVRMRSLGAHSYREYTPERDLKVALAITDSELVVGFSHTKAFDQVVAYMLGEKLPARSMADVEVLEHIQAKYEFSPYAVGYVDIHGIASVATGAAPGDKITRAMLDAVDYQAPPMEEVCRTELMSFFEAVPRAVVGYTKFTPELLEMTAVLETEHAFARELADTAAPMPAYGSPTVENSLLSVGLGIDLEKLSNFVALQADRINRNPFECPDFQQFNDAAQQAQMARAMIPPFVTQLRGAIAVVTGIEFGQRGMQPTGFDGLALIETADPKTLFSQLQQFVPEFRGATVEPDGVPVGLDGLSQVPWLQVPHAAMDQDTLAMSAGVGTQDDMAILLEDQKGDDRAVDTPLLVVAYDYGALMSQWYGAMMTGSGASAQPMAGTFDILGEIMGTVVAELDVSDDGLIVRYRAHMFPEGRSGASR